MTVRFAVLGAGRIGRVHAAAIAGVPGAALAAVADPVAEAAQAVRDTHGGEVRTIDEIAAADDVDAVVICTPTDTHADLIEQFAKAGKAVFCEKPVDLSLARVRDCLPSSARTGHPDGRLQPTLRPRFHGGEGRHRRGPGRRRGDGHHRQPRPGRRRPITSNDRAGSSAT